MNVIFSFPRQAAGEERSVHGRRGAVSASGRRAARRVRRRLETGGKTQRTSWSHSLLVEGVNHPYSADFLCPVGRDPEQVRGDHGRHRCGARAVERRCRRIGSTFAVTFLSILPGKTF
jgi:hypothetical protein